MTGLVVAAAQGAAVWDPSAAGGVLRAATSLAFVLGLLALLAWLLRRGTFGNLGRRRGPVAVERAIALGERRSLVIVSVEGRRLLLGLTPAQVSLVADLGTSGHPDSQGAAGDPAFAETLDRTLAVPGDALPVSTEGSGA